MTMSDNNIVLFACHEAAVVARQTVGQRSTYTKLAALS